MQIISEARWEEQPDTFGLFFARRGDEGSGFMFDCDADGNLAPMTDTQRASMREACDGARYHAPEVRQFVQRAIRHAAIGRCGCGAEVELSGFTNTCDKCGAEYNWAGQALAPREQWGEETGEHPADLSRIA